MFPELVSDKIHFYIWKSNINKCNKEYQDSIDFLPWWHGILYFNMKIYNYRSLRRYGVNNGWPTMDFEINIYNARKCYVSRLPRNY